MFKIKMNEFIIALMKEYEVTELYIAEIMEAVLKVSNKADIMLYDSFNNTLESVLDAIVIYPEHFVLSTYCKCIALKNKDSLDELSKHWEVPEQIVFAIKEYVQEKPIEIFGCTSDFTLSEEKEKSICSSTKFIDWIWEKTSVRSIGTKDFSQMHTAKDLANLTKIPNLFVLLSRYYSNNLLSHYTRSDYEEYIFKYNKDGEERYFVIFKLVYEEEYKIGRCVVTENAPYFPEVALGTEEINTAKRKLSLKKFELLFRQSRKLGLKYEYVLDTLKNVYGIG